MEENNIRIYKENRKLKVSLYLQLFMLLLLTFENIVIANFILFTDKLYLILYIICSIGDFILIFFPIHPLVLIYKKKLYSKKAKLYILLSIIVSLLIFIFGFLMVFILEYFENESKNFYIDCLYNLINNSNIHDDFNNFKEKKNNNKFNQNCFNKKCILVQVFYFNQTNSSYYCNFNSSDDFNQIFHYDFNDKNRGIFCELYNKSESLNNNVLNLKNEQNAFNSPLFFENCSPNNRIYKCYRNKKPKNFKIKDDFSCPKEYNNFLHYIGISYFFYIVIFLIIYGYNIIKFRKIYTLSTTIVLASISTQNSLKNSTNSNNKDNNNDIQNGKDTDNVSGTIIIGVFPKNKEEDEDIKCSDENIDNKKTQNNFDNNDDIIFNNEKILNLKVIENNNINEKINENTDRLKLQDNKIKKQ